MQSRRASLIEATANTAVSFVLATGLNWFFLWAFTGSGMLTQGAAAVVMTVTFTAISFVRQYTLRRIFNARENR